MTSLIKRELTSSKGIKHVWEGIGWYSHDRQMIIVSNCWEKKIVKVDDFMKAETMSDLNQIEYKRFYMPKNAMMKVSEHDKYLRGESYKLAWEE